MTMSPLEQLDLFARAHRARVSTAAWVLALPILLRPTAPHAPGSTAFPLDPLSREEIVATHAVLTSAGKIHPATRIATITLSEPAKETVLASLHGGQPAPRAASVVLYDWSTAVGSIGTVDLRQHAIVSWTDLPPADPPILGLIIARSTEAAKANPRFRDAMARHGYSDLSRVRVEPEFALGGSPAPPKAMGSDYVLTQRDGQRVVVSGVSDQDAADGGVSRGLGGLTVWENLTRGTVDSLHDEAPASKPGALSAAGAAGSGKLVQQGPQGTAGTGHLEIRGTEVRWGRWRFHAGVDPRRGLELYGVGFVDQGTVRSILYRASISEMIAPYGDPGFGSWFPMDEGDIGLASYGMTSAVPGEDAPANAVLLPAVFADDMGKPVELPRAIAIFERETAVQWRHANTAQRARELVVRGYCTADNYDYVFDWVFREDGSIQVQVSLTGVMNAHDVPAKA